MLATRYKLKEQAQKDIKKDINKVDKIANVDIPKEIKKELGADLNPENKKVAVDTDKKFCQCS